MNLYIHRCLKILTSTVLLCGAVTAPYSAASSSLDWFVQPVYGWIDTYSDGYALIKQNDKWGYLDETAKVVIEPQYESASAFVDGIAVVDKPGGPRTFINKRQEPLFATEFKAAFSFSEGLAGVKQDRLWGFINREGTLVIDYQFDNVEKFKEGRCIVGKDQRYGIIDASGRYIVEPVLAYARFYSEGYVAVQVPTNHKITYLDGRIGWKAPKMIGTVTIDYFTYLDKNGAMAFYNTAHEKETRESMKDSKSTLRYFNAAYPFSTGYAAVRHDKLWGFIGTDGVYSIPPKYKRIIPFGDTAIAFVLKREGRWLAINHSGENLFTIKADDAWPYSEGFAKIRTDGKYGFIDDRGKAVTAVEFDDAYDVKGGLAQVKMNGKWGLLRLRKP
ncbi:MAG: WG repeat-containing protein [Chitinispirillaceae bacterium]|nr:WG repeat-containing protein [Chitinispirillaceae bacterium]